LSDYTKLEFTIPRYLWKTNISS